jgi:1-acyl-sn-glycerol-3-phosphate acyltransferase
MPDSQAHVLLTGGTGFLGKVILEELIRRADELRVTRIYLLIRPKRGRTPEDRFVHEVVGSECFRLLPDQWQTRCVIVDGNVTAPEIGLSPADAELLSGSITHIINCAASIDFDRPLDEAARSNIDGALNMLAFAKRCTALRSMVHVSTAYVWPERLAAHPCGESLVPLPFQPEVIHADITAGGTNRDELLQLTGHPNTYTFTKCLAEHLLFANREDVPLRIVRPSVISACRVHPFPGWIDSTSGFTGLVVLFGHGLLRVLAAEPENRPDIVPCDEVVDRVLRSAFEPENTRPIEHAVAGQHRSLAIHDIIDGVEEFFSTYPTGARTGFHHVGPWGGAVVFREWLHTTLPHFVAHSYLSATRQAKKARRLRRVNSMLLYVNRGFRYFAQSHFDFSGAEPGTVPAFDPFDYHRIINSGVHRHLLKHGTTEIPVAGRRHTERGSDLRWAVGRPRGNPTIRFGAYLLRKMWRRCTDLVTFDQAAFVRARAAAQPGDLVVIVPTHRSYFDFLVLPYLFFARPDLGIDIPHIAATEDFARIPVVSTLLRQGQAFFIRRGVGKADPDLTRRVSELAANGRTLKFFIEGTRSRSRRVLPPRRGLLRALQSTGRSCLILPVVVSYDRIPEEVPLARELAGVKKEPHRLRSILKWVRRLHRGEVHLGRIHVTCGTPLRLDPHTDVPALGRSIAAELQAATVISTFHLRAFLARCPLPGVDLARLRRAVEQRGGVVVDSSLPTPAHIDDTLHQCLLNQWQPFFFADIGDIAQVNPALKDHLEQHAWMTRSHLAAPIPGLLEALFACICQHYADVARHIADQTNPGDNLALAHVAGALPQAFRPDVELALRDLAKRGILAEHDDGFRWDGRREPLLAYAQSCEWPAKGGQYLPSQELSQPPAAFA